MRRIHTYFIWLLAVLMALAGPPRPLKGKMHLRILNKPNPGPIQIDGRWSIPTRFGYRAVPAGGDIIQGGVVIEDGIPRPVDPFAKVRVVLSTGTIQAVVNSAEAGDIIYIEPGSYDEQVTIPATISKLTLVGLGGRGAVFIAPTAANPTALTNHADDVTLINVGCEGSGTGGGLLNTGRRFRDYGCKFEGGANAAIYTLGTDAQITAGTRGKGDDTRSVDSEFYNAGVGILLRSSDYGPMTQNQFRRPYIHGITATTGVAIDEDDVGAIGTVRELLIENPIFGRDEGGDEPGVYIDLDSAGSTGFISGLRAATQVLSSTLFALAAGIILNDWRTEREGSPASGGTNGRPD